MIWRYMLYKGGEGDRGSIPPIVCVCMRLYGVSMSSQSILSQLSNLDSLFNSSFHPLQTYSRVSSSRPSPQSIPSLTSLNNFLKQLTLV